MQGGLGRPHHDVLKARHTITLLQLPHRPLRLVPLVRHMAMGRARMTKGVLAFTEELAPGNLSPLRQSSSTKCFPAFQMVSRHPAPSPLGAVIIPRVSSAPWIPSSRESHESICHHPPPRDRRGHRARQLGRAHLPALV